MRSLRQRLGVTIALGAVALTAVATTVVVHERWREAVAALPSAVELEAFRLAESTGLGLDDLPGEDGFALMLDGEAVELATVGTVDGKQVRVNACLVVHLDAGGKIARFEEHTDMASAAPFAKALGMG